MWTFFFTAMDPHVAPSLSLHTVYIEFNETDLSAYEAWGSSDTSQAVAWEA
jgi:hypothetical protein